MLCSLSTLSFLLIDTVSPPSFQIAYHGISYKLKNLLKIFLNFCRVAVASRKFQIEEMRIFPFGSSVEDIYNGSLETLGSFLQQSELRFVAYYAPWCAQSRKMVPEMGLAANILKDTVSTRQF